MTHESTTSRPGANDKDVELFDYRRHRVYSLLPTGAQVNRSSLIGFLRDLKRHFRDQRIILVWDGLPSHKSYDMVAYLHGQRSWLSIERLPGYAPDLNTTELVWGNVKGQELANLCADNLDEVKRRVRREPTLAFAFLRHTGLSL